MADGPWLQRVPKAGAAARVFCIPQAGCGSNVFGNWPRELESVEFLPVELPGRLTRFAESMPATFQELAQAMIAGLRPYLDVPFAFFGHCWSALVGYELAVQLDRAGLPPAQLFVSSQVAPQDGPFGRMLAMSRDELASELRKTIASQGKSPHPELVAIYVNVLRTDIDVYRRYVVPEPPRISSPITAIGWSDDSEVRPSQMTGWTECGDTSFPILPGQHNQFMDAPPELLRILCSNILK